MKNNFWLGDYEITQIEINIMKANELLKRIKNQPPRLREEDRKDIIIEFMSSLAPYIIKMGITTDFNELNVFNNNL